MTPAEYRAAVSVVPPGHTRASWIARLQTLATACRPLHPELADLYVVVVAELQQRQADDVGLDGLVFRRVRPGVPGGAGHVGDAAHVEGQVT